MEAECKIPAAKLFVSQLDLARQPPQAAASLDVRQTGLVLLGLEFTRVWLQGTVVKVDSPGRSFVVDDGTGTFTASMPEAKYDLDEGIQENGDAMPQLGTYVLTVGAVAAGDGFEVSSCCRYRLLCDVIKDVGAACPNRDIVWGLEIIDFWKTRRRRDMAALVAPD